MQTSIQLWQNNKVLYMRMAYALAAGDTIRHFAGHDLGGETVSGAVENHDRKSAFFDPDQRPVSCNSTLKYTFVNLKIREDISDRQPDRLKSRFPIRLASWCRYGKFEPYLLRIRRMMLGVG